MTKRLKFVVERWVLFMVRGQTWQARRFKIFESARHFRIGTSNSNSNQISKLRRSLVTSSLERCWYHRLLFYIIGSCITRSTRPSSICSASTNFTWPIRFSRPIRWPSSSSACYYTAHSKWGRWWWFTSNRRFTRYNVEFWVFAICEKSDLLPDLFNFTYVARFVLLNVLFIFMRFCFLPSCLFVLLSFVYYFNVVFIYYKCCVSLCWKLLWCLCLFRVMLFNYTAAVNGVPEETDMKDKASMITDGEIVSAV